MGPVDRKKILRQHRDLRRVLHAVLAATQASESHDARRFSVLVSLTMRLQNLLERHVVFEEQILSAHLSAEDQRTLEQLARAHRRQRTELSVLAKLAFQDVAQTGVPQAFRALIEDLLGDMDDEERILLRGVRRKVGRQISKAR